MIDGSEKRNRWWAFELQNSHVCEKRSKCLFSRGLILKIDLNRLENPPPCSSPYWLPNTETIVLSTNQNHRLNMSLVTAYRHDRHFALNIGWESSLRVWKQLKHEHKLQEKVYSSLCWIIFLTWRNRIWWEFFLIRLQTSLTCTCKHALHHNREAG